MNNSSNNSICAIYYMSDPIYIQIYNLHLILSVPSDLDTVVMC
jgi:hypothetical protein